MEKYSNWIHAIPPRSRFFVGVFLVGSLEIAFGECQTPTSHNLLVRACEITALAFLAYLLAGGFKRNFREFFSVCSLSFSINCSAGAGDRARECLRYAAAGSADSHGGDD